MTRSSKRKTAKSSQEVVPEECKENSPSILSQSTSKRFTARNRNLVSLKENISPSVSSTKLRNSTGVKTNKEFYSPVRKSARSFLKPSITDQNKGTGNKVLSERTVLCDKTNVPKIKGNNEPVKEACHVLRTTENKKNIVQKLITVPYPNRSLAVSSCSKKGVVENHVPVYKTVGSLVTDSKIENPQNGKKEAVYEFEVDENEEPAQKKKRKKRTYVKKPKIGPKALTINNIKYSSTESLVSLPEKSVARKKRATKTAQTYIKPYSSVSNLNDIEDTCYSVKSFMSHPSSVILCEGNEIRAKTNLSVLQETQSESCQSPVQLTVNADVHENPCENPPVSLNSSNWHDVHFSPNPRCYVSKTSLSNNHNNGSHGSLAQTSVNDTLPLQSSWTNVSHSSRDFLSSTPCKRVSLVVRDNSVFDNSYDLPQNLRPSTGYIKDALGKDISASDNCFGFDEPEELEEPLVSPIKNTIDLGFRKVVKVPQELQAFSKEDPKPSAREVIEMLKASLPQAKTKESTVFDMSGHSNSSSPTNVDKEIMQPTAKFRMPARRSYERQRRIRHHSEHEEESEEERVEEEKENVPKEVKKNTRSYKKINASKASKPAKVPKAKQKIAKEEEEMERLVAQMNAQFQEIEKVNLVVE